jgi:prevent-host-death family protein
MYTFSMAHRYSIADARSNLPRIVDEAEAGAEVELTRRGQPVAVVVSRRTFDRLRDARTRFDEAYQRFLERFSLEEIGLDEADVRTTRDRTTGRPVRR